VVQGDPQERGNFFLDIEKYLRLRKPGLQSPVVPLELREARRQWVAIDWFAPAFLGEPIVGTQVALTPPDAQVR
jgi:hypothetical protein